MDVAILAAARSARQKTMSAPSDKPVGEAAPSLKDKPPSLAPSMELRPPAPPPPTVGENGVPNAPSDAKYAEAAKIDATVKALSQQKARIERELDSSKGVSASVRAKARLAISNLDTQITALSERGGAAKRQADQAKMAEDKARAEADRKRQEAEKAVEKSKDQIHDLVAWGGSAERQRYMKADISREDVRAEIDIAHMREKEKHTAAAQAREAKKFTPEYRNSLEAFVEADPESTITDARSLSDDELYKEYNLSRKRDEAAARQANIDKDDKRADERMKLSNEVVRMRRFRDFDKKISTLEGNLSKPREKYDGNPDEDWNALGKARAERDALEREGSEPAPAPAVPAASDPDAQMVKDYDALPPEEKAKVPEALRQMVERARRR